MKTIISALFALSVLAGIAGVAPNLSPPQSVAGKSYHRPPQRPHQHHRAAHKPRSEE